MIKNTKHELIGWNSIRRQFKKRNYSESAMTKEIITSTKKLKIDNKKRHLNVYDDSNG